MKEIKDDCYKGTRIILGNEKQDYIQNCREYLISLGHIEISIPIIQLQEVFKNKVGFENNNLMFNFNDRKGRNICLSPEYTAVIQKLSKSYFKNQKNVKLFYVQECFRGEKPQAGRYRQFTQFGVEILNPTCDYDLAMKFTAQQLIQNRTDNYIINEDVTRGLDYYKEGKGFEIVCEELGSSKQVCGGGSYEGGIGFAIGVDRVLQLNKTIL